MLKLYINNLVNYLLITLLTYNFINNFILITITMYKLLNKFIINFLRLLYHRFFQLGISIIILIFSLSVPNTGVP